MFEIKKKHRPKAFWLSFWVFIPSYYNLRKVKVSLREFQRNGRLKCKPLVGNSLSRLTRLPEGPMHTRWYTVQSDYDSHLFQARLEGKFPPSPTSLICDGLAIRSLTNHSSEEHYFQPHPKTLTFFVYTVETHSLERLDGDHDLWLKISA